MNNGKYGPKKSEDIARLIRSGVPAIHACVASDISQDTYYRWLKEKPEFSELIKKAESERLATLVLAIRKDISWQSKAWLLERLYRDEFGAVNERALLERVKAIEEKINNTQHGQ